MKSILILSFWKYIKKKVTILNVCFDGVVIFISPWKPEQRGKNNYAYLCKQRGLINLQ